MADSLYRAIAQDLRDQILSGALKPGEQLPTEVELRERYGDVSRNTVRDAIKLLVAQRMVTTKPGAGTFVRRETIEPFVTTLTATMTETGLGGGEGTRAFSEVKERGKKPSASIPRVEHVSAPDYIASRLSIPVGAEVITRRQERFIDGRPWSIQLTAYPAWLVERGAVDLQSAKDIPDGAVSYIEQTIDLVQIGHRDRVLVRPSAPEETAFFRLPDDGRVQMVSLVRTAYYADPEGVASPFRVTFTVFPADRNQFVIDSGQVPQELAQAVSDQYYRAPARPKSEQENSIEQPASTSDSGA
jgi:GntR family transcriptional regulator